jgi:hypothetical protein
MCSTAAILGAVITAPAYAQTSALPNQRGTYRHLEVSFDIVGLTTDPFNYETTDVQVKFQLPDGSTMTSPPFTTAARLGARATHHRLLAPTKFSV